MNIPIVAVWLCFFAAAAMGEKSLRHVELSEMNSKSVELLARAHGPNPNQLAIHRGSGKLKTQCETIDPANYNGIAVNQNNGVVVVSNSVGTYSQYYYADCWEQISTLKLKKLVTANDYYSNLLIFGIGVSDGKVYRGVYDSDSNSYTFSVLLGDATYSDLLLITKTYFVTSAYSLAAVTSASIRLQQYDVDEANTLIDGKTVTRASTSDKPFFLSVSYLCQSIASSGAIVCSDIGTPSDSDTSAATAVSALTVTNVNTVCGSVYGALFVTDSWSKLKTYYYDYNGAYTASTEYSLGSNSWIVASCDQYYSSQLTLVVSSTPSIVKTYASSGGYISASTSLNPQGIDLTSSSMITTLQGYTYLILIPTNNLIRAYGGFISSNYYYGDGLKFQEDFGIIYGFYLLYFFGLVLIALVLDNTKFFDTFVIPLARRSYINMEDRLLKQLFQTNYLTTHPEMKDLKPTDNEKFLDWEDADVVAEYTEFISHRKLVAAAAEEGDLGAESSTLDQTEPAPGGGTGCFSSIVSCCGAFGHWLRSYYNLCAHPNVSKQLQMPAWFFNAIRGVLYLNTTPYNPDDRRQYLNLVFFKVPFAKGYWVRASVCLKLCSMLRYVVIALPTG